MYTRTHTWLPGLLAGLGVAAAAHGQGASGLDGAISIKSQEAVVDVPVQKLNDLIDDIESELRDSGTTDVSSEDLGRMVLKRLVSIDKVAYVRFASVYRDFKDVDEFSEELRSLNQ